MYAGPNWTRDASGEWQEIDTNLVLGADGVVRPKAAAVDVVLSAARGAGQADNSLVRVAVPRGSLADIAQARTDRTIPVPSTDKAGSDAVSVTVGFDGALPSPLLVGNEAVYRDVAPGRDLRVAVLPSGIETFVDLSSPPARIPDTGLEVRLPMNLNGLSVRQSELGGLEVVDPDSGKAIASTPQAQAWDASSHPITGDSLHSVALSTRLERSKSGWDVVVTVPSSFFQTKGLTYPVTVDPLVGLDVAADTFVQKGNDSSSFGSYAYMNIGTYDAGTHVARAYLGFTLGSAQDLYDPHTVIETARLKVWEYDANSCTPSDLFIRRLTSPFNESTVTWNSKPTQTSALYTVSDARIAGQAGACTASWIDSIYGTDVPSIVQDWADGTYSNYGFALTASETSSTGWKRIYSSNYSGSDKRPSLDVRYHHVPTDPNSLVVGDRNGAGWVKTATPTLAAVVADLDGGDVQGRFYLSTSSTFSPTTWTGTNTVASGQSAAATTGTLSEGTQYYARARAAQASPVTGNLEYSGYTAGVAFKVDSVAPAVTVACTGLPQDQVTDPAPSSNVPCSASATDATSGVGSFTSITLDGSSTAVVNMSGTGSARTFSLDKTALTEGGHTLAVTATDIAGNSTTKSYWFGIHTTQPPSAPTAVSATPGNGQVAVSWNAPASDGGAAVTGYTVTAAPGGATATTTGATAATVTGLANGTAYTFTVAATNSAGTGPSSAPSAAATPIGPPAAPTQLIAIPGSGSITVSWTTPSSTGGSPITNYTVTSDPGSHTCTAISGLSCTVTGLTDGDFYTFTATATNAVGTGRVCRNLCVSGHRLS